MRLELFSEGDKILLLGEGNFSFAKDLVNHNLPVEIIATCFEDVVSFKNQKENVDYLATKGVPVIFGVDARKIHENACLRDLKFSKIIFNFPHVGGKMKIQLNRNLLREICESCCQILNHDGVLVISLCNGQGGTPFDNPQRRWDDSWQITEMAAYGNFYLNSVEPFNCSNFDSYSCVGYRSQDVHFNLNRALVHILKLKTKSFGITDESEALKRLSLVPLFNGSEVSVPFYYSELYLKNPFKNENSAVNYFKNLVLESIKDSEMRVILQEDVPVFVKNSLGTLCKVSGIMHNLRNSAFQVLDMITNEIKLLTQNEIVFYPGVYFNFSLESDFHCTPPIMLQFLLVGQNATSMFQRFIKKLFKSDSKLITHNEIQYSDFNLVALKYFSFNKVIEWLYSTDSSCKAFAHELILDFEDHTLEAYAVYVDCISEILLSVQSWKEIWSETNWISDMILHQDLIFPNSYKFDVTLQYDSSYKLLDSSVFEVLRQSAVELIKSVDLISEFESNSDWSSKCFRITYESLNLPLNRKKALDIHINVICKMLTFCLPVIIK